MCPPQTSTNLKIDSCANHHLKRIRNNNLPQQPPSNYNPEAQVIVPNGASMVSSKTMHLPILSLPPSATKSHGFNHLEYGYLFSVGQACYCNFTAVFDKQNINIFKSTEVSIKVLCPPIIQGHHNSPSQPLY